MLEIQLPSGREDVAITPFTADYMGSLYNAQKYEQPELFISTLQNFVNVSLKDMYLEDFRVLLAMIDRDSWLEGHRLYEWRCERPFYVSKGKVFLERPVGQKWRLEDCKKLNNTDATNQRIIQEKWRTLPEGIVHPTVGRWMEAVVLAEQYGKMAYDAMWIDSDVSLQQTLNIVSVTELMTASTYAYAIARLQTKFKCNHCGRQYTHEAPIEILGFLRTQSRQSMMNMTLDLSGAGHGYIPDNVPLAKLLYWHSCFIKDLQRAKEEKAKRDAKRKR